jgi:serine/threonine protein phosphatase PrpC
MISDSSRMFQGAHSDFSGPTSGSTAVVALVRGDKIVVANAGDSRCVLSRGGKVCSCREVLNMYYLC